MTSQTTPTPKSLRQRLTDAAREAAEGSIDCLGKAVSVQDAWIFTLDQAAEREDDANADFPQEMPFGFAWQYAKAVAELENARSQKKAAERYLVVSGPLGGRRGRIVLEDIAVTGEDEEDTANNVLILDTYGYSLVKRSDIRKIS
jgi:hypothetical protein